MAQMRVFVSHSHEDDTFCRGIVAALRGAGQMAFEVHPRIVC